MEHHVFISYRRVDSPVAETIEAGLREAGLRCWRDRVLEWGVDFPLEIREAIKQSQVVLVMISEHAGESQWMVREVDMAFEQERPVLPVVTGVARVEVSWRNAWGTYSTCRWLVRPRRRISPRSCMSSATEGSARWMSQQTGSSTRCSSLATFASLATRRGSCGRCQR